MTLWGGLSRYGVVSYVVGLYGKLRYGFVRYIGEILRSRYGIVRHAMGWYGTS